MSSKYDPVAFEQALLGKVFNNRYKLQTPLGRGGYGAVIEAVDLVLERSVAVKVLHPTRARDEVALRRFNREARILARLDHPNAVRVLDFSQSEEGLRYLVLELVRGRTLSEILLQEWPLSLDRMVSISLQVSEMLKEAHEVGIIHRDLKPDNILVSTQRGGGEVVKVVDFGISRVTGVRAGQTSSGGQLVGTPEYMSPEHCSNKEITKLSDIYSFGCVLYEMICGLPPFSSSSPAVVMAAHVNRPPQVPTARVPGLTTPPHLQQLAMDCLEKEPGARPASAAELSHRLRKVLEIQQNAPTGTMDALTRLPKTLPRRSLGGRPSSSSDVAAFLKGSVLIVDYSGRDGQILEQILREQGILCVLRSELPHADAFEAFAAAFVLVRDGFDEDVESLRELSARSIPAIVCARDLDAAGMTRALECGAFDYVRCPPDARALGRALARAARSRRKKHE